MSQSIMFHTGTVLIIEDNISNMMMAKDLLEMAGFKTLQAENADIGVKLAREQHPDLILMDMHLPIMDGYEASRILKSDPETQDIVIVGFTALAMEEEKEKAFAHGCSGIISKPIEVDHFTDTIAGFIKAKPQMQIVDKFSEADRFVNVVPATSQITYSDKDSNVLRIHQLEEALLQSNARLEQFLVRASHDLQSPLRKISQFSGMLQHAAAHELSSDNKKLLAGIIRSSQQMQDILSDLLTMSRLHCNPRSLCLVPLSKIITEIIDENRDKIKSLGVRVELGNLIMLQTDPAQLKQLLQELFDNALKFAQEDTPLVIRISSGVEEGRHYFITVEDNGIGFEPKYTDRIFLPLERLHGVSQYPGRGMGLAIAKKVVECHAGAINVHSVPGQGSIFTVLLPVPHL